MGTSRVQRRLTALAPGLLSLFDGEGKKVRRLSAVLGCIAVVLVAALPATANNKPTTGTRLGLGPLAPTVFTADTAFYIEHGFVCELDDVTCIQDQITGTAEFDLYLDGVLQPSTVDVDLVDGALGKQHLTNYESGLPAGTYTFVGVWSLDGTVVQTRTKTITLD